MTMDNCKRVIRNIINSRIFTVAICMLFALGAAGYYYGLLLEFPPNTEEMSPVWRMYYSDVMAMGRIDIVAYLGTWLATKIGGMSYFAVRLSYVFFFFVIICLVLYLCLENKTGNEKHRKIYLLPLIALLCVILFPVADNPALCWDEGGKDLIYIYPFQYHTSARIYALLCLILIDLAMKSGKQYIRRGFYVLLGVVCLYGMGTKDLIFYILFLLPAGIVLGKWALYHAKYHKTAIGVISIGLICFAISRFMPIEFVRKLWTNEHADVYGAIYGGTNWISIKSIGEHLLNYIQLICFDFNIQLSNLPVISFYSVVYLFKVVIIIIGYIVMGHVVVKSIAGKSVQHGYDYIDEILAWSYLLLSLVFIFTEFGSMPFVRYFTALPSVMTIVLCRNMDKIPDIIHIEALKRIDGKRFLLCVCTIAMCICSMGKVWTYRAPDNYEEDLKAIAAYLEDAEYGYAVAPYWIYSKISAMSNGKVLVCRSEEEVKAVFGEAAEVHYIVTHSDQSADNNIFAVYENCEDYESICAHYSEPSNIIRYNQLELLIFEDGIQQPVIE